MSEMKRKTAGGSQCECSEGMTKVFNKKGHIVAIEQNSLGAHDCNYIAMRNALIPHAARRATELYPPSYIEKKWKSGFKIVTLANPGWTAEFFRIMDQLVKSANEKERREP